MKSWADSDSDDSEDEFGGIRAGLNDGSIGSTAVKTEGEPVKVVRHVLHDSDSDSDDDAGDRDAVTVVKDVTQDVPSAGSDGGDEGEGEKVVVQVSEMENNCISCYVWGNCLLRSLVGECRICVLNLFLN